MARENPTWGRRRIQAELRFLGYDVMDVWCPHPLQCIKPRVVSHALSAAQRGSETPPANGP